MGLWWCFWPNILSLQVLIEIRIRIKTRLWQLLVLLTFWAFFLIQKFITCFPSCLQLCHCVIWPIKMLPIIFGFGGSHAISLNPFLLLFTIDSEISFFKIHIAKKILFCLYQISETTKLDILVASICTKNTKTYYLKYSWNRTVIVSCRNHVCLEPCAATHT